MTETFQDALPKAIDRDWEQVTVEICYRNPLTDEDETIEHRLDRAEMEGKRQRRLAAEAVTVEQREQFANAPLPPAEFRQMVENYATQATVTPVDLPDHDEGPLAKVIIPPTNIQHVVIRVDRTASGILAPNGS